jgi:hypothetical protein
VGAHGLLAIRLRQRQIHATAEGYPAKLGEGKLSTQTVLGSGAAFGQTKRTRAAMLQIVVFLMMQASYNLYITDIFSYQGYAENFNALKFLGSLFAVPALALIIPSSRPVASFLLNLSLATTITPIFVIYAGSDLPAFLPGTTVFAFLLMLVSSRFTVTGLSAVSLSPSLVLNALALSGLVLLASFYQFGAFSTLNFDFSQVYALRREVAASLPAIYGYLVPVFSKSIIPIATVIALASGRRMAVIGLLACSALLFGLTTHKGILFYPLVSIFVYVAISRYKGTSLFLTAIISVIAISALDLAFIDVTGGWVGSLLLRRALFTPALLTHYYLEYFGTNPWYWWSHSRFSFGLVEMPYDRTAPFEIGSQYFSREDMSANVGLIGSGYSNAGLLGIAIYAVLAGWLFALMQGLSTRFSGAFVVAIFMPQLLAMLTSTDLTTLLITHGVLLSIAILMFLGKGTRHHAASASNIASPASTPAAGTTPALEPS